jgi:hypothetical protein
MQCAVVIGAQLRHPEQPAGYTRYARNGIEGHPKPPKGESLAKNPATTNVPLLADSRHAVGNVDLGRCGLAGSASRSVKRLSTVSWVQTVSDVSGKDKTSVVGGMGLEPMTIRLKVECSTS